MSFRLVSNSVTLDDPERRNSPNRSVISPNSVAFGADYVKVVEDTLIGLYTDTFCSGNVGQRIELVCITEFTHSRVVGGRPIGQALPVNQLTLLTFNLSSTFHFTIMF